MNAPNKCPICGDKENWKLIDTTKKGFNAKNAVIGGVLLGGIGLAAGLSGKKESLYQCVKCGFSHEYDGVADKDAKNITAGEYNNKGLNAVYIDTIKKVTPDCVFCGKPQDLYIKQDGGGYRFKCGQCYAEFRCEFTFGGKIKGNSTQIIDCGETNINNLQVGSCNADILIKDISKIK
ncbi:MAG: hypothetical protein ACI4NG_02075 [Candidatus Gallimonas sp.]